MLLDARSDIASWPSVLIVCGPGFKTAAHRHHCVQLLLTLRASLLVRSGPKATWRKCTAVWVRPDALHEVDAVGSTLLLAFVNAESEMGGVLAARIKTDIACVPARKVARWRAVLGPMPNEERAHRWLTEFLHPRRATAIHPGVRRVLSYLQAPRTASDDLSLTALAGVAGLSSSRLMHAFTQSVGVPLRPYILWLRLQRAACDLMNGASVTNAAHRAGFSDAAHLTRTFRRMLGATPSDLALLSRLSLGFSSDASDSADRAIVASRNQFADR
jgi:AraC-like DNA-binding protein